MAVAVFGQLDHVLRERNLTIADLKRQIEERDGLIVDVAVLDHLASGQRLPQTDLTTVGAVASILGVSLDDLLFVVTVPFPLTPPPTKASFLNEEETWRLWALLGMQDTRELSDGERRELDWFVDEARRRSEDYFSQSGAQRQEASPEPVLREEPSASPRR